jgi:predicted amidophosphoribosyltransferase
MVGPRQGPSVCQTCFNFTDHYTQCYTCVRNEPWADVVAPISYSVARGHLHRALASYKRVNGGSAGALATGLAAVLWRFLAAHERCLVAQVGVERFQLVTAVPSSDRLRDRQHPLHWIVGELVGPTRPRHQRLLERSAVEVAPRTLDPRKFQTRRELSGEPVLLVDDTWTTGASVQSAAAALKMAGAGPVVAVVIGRYLNRGWQENERRLRGITRPFDWSRCPLCA